MNLDLASPSGWNNVRPKLQGSRESASSAKRLLCVVIPFGRYLEECHGYQRARDDSRVCDAITVLQSSVTVVGLGGATRIEVRSPHHSKYAISRPSRSSISSRSSLILRSTDAKQMSIARSFNNANAGDVDNAIAECFYTVSQPSSRPLSNHCCLRRCLTR